MTNLPVWEYMGRPVPVPAPDGRIEVCHYLGTLFRGGGMGAVRDSTIFERAGWACVCVCVSGYLRRGKRAERRRGRV